MEAIMSLSNKCIRVETNEKEVGYTYKLLQRNKICHLLHIDMRNMDDVCYFYYDVSSKKSLRDTFKKQKITIEQIDSVINNLYAALQELEKYLLNASDLCLKPECIMEDINTREKHFLYVPNYQEDQKEDLDILMEFLLERLDMEDDEAIEEMYTFYNECLLCGNKLTAVLWCELWKKGKETTCQGDEKGIPKLNIEKNMDSYLEVAQSKDEKFGWIISVWKKKIYKFLYNEKNQH